MHTTMDITLPRRAVSASVASPQAGGDRWRARIETTLILGGLLALLFFLPHTMFGDGEKRYLELAQLLQGHGFSTDKYSLIGPLFSSPLWLLGALYRDPAWWLARFNLFIFAGGLGVIYLLLRHQVNRGLLRRFFLILIIGSMFPNHLKAYYGEVFTAVLVGVGVVAAVFGRRLAGWASVAIGVANTPATLVALGVALALRVWRRRKLRVALALVAAGVLILAENWVRRGNPLASRYESGFTFPIVFGVLSLLFSFGKGVLWFAPGLLLPVKRRLLGGGSKAGGQMYEVYLLWLAFLAGLILVYGHWYDWSGDWFWGPRFLLFASLPASFALAVWLSARDASWLAQAITLAALAWCVWVGINGAVYDQAPLLPYCFGPASPDGAACQYLPQTSVLWSPLVTGMRLRWKSWLWVAYSLIVFAYLAQPFAQSLLRAAWRRAHDWRPPRLARLAEWF